jgi:hypothetical protein
MESSVESKTVRLSSTVTIPKYGELEEAKDTFALADFVYERLSERYIRPVSACSKNGFAMMACGCLLIETMESFYKGWKTTEKKGRGKQAVRQFFDRWNGFADFRGYEDDFYKNVRCGILHQGETKRGWRITRDKAVPVFVRDHKLINATKFMNRISSALGGYRNELRAAAWNQIIWRNFRQKMDSIIKNCED